MLLQVYLDQEIKKLCPIHGVSFGVLTDKSTWKINYKDEATDEQKRLAQQVIVDFVWDEKNQKEQSDKLFAEQYRDDLLYKKEYKEYKEKKPDATFYDFIKYLQSINL